MSLTFGSWTVSDSDALDAVLHVDDGSLAGYDFSGRSVPDDVDAADIGRLLADGHVEVPAAEAAQLMAAAKHAPWAAVPIDARLDDAEPGSPLHAATVALLDHFLGIPTVDSAKATRLLALKRPSLYAAVDDQVRLLYTVAVENGEQVPHPVTAAIRADLCRSEDKAGIRRLRDGLLADRGHTARRLAQLPEVRLRGLVASQRWEMVGKPASAAPWPDVAPW